ncbi:hypothetical protein D3C72_1135270 [compost metagenome]
MFVDILARAIPFHGLAAFVPAAICARMHPAVLAILPAHAHFLVERLAAAHRFAPGRQGMGNVFGVDGFQPAGAQAVAARPFAPALRDIVELAVDIGRPQHLRVQFDGVMKVFAAVVQRLFQLAPLDDMRGHARGQRQQFDLRLRGMACRLEKQAQHAQDMPLGAKDGGDPAGAVAVQQGFLASRAPVHVARDVAAIHGRAGKGRRAERGWLVAAMAQRQAQVLWQAGRGQAAKAVGLVDEHEAGMRAALGQVLQRQQQVFQCLGQIGAGRDAAQRTMLGVQQGKNVVCVHRVDKGKTDARNIPWGNPLAGGNSASLDLYVHVPLC